MAQTSGFDPTTQPKACFDYKMLDVSNWVASLNGEDGREGCLHMRPSQFHLKEHWKYPQSLDSLLPWTDAISAYLDWCDERLRSLSQRPQYPTLYRCLKQRLGRSLRSKFYKGSVVRSGKKAPQKCRRVEGGLTGPLNIQGPVSEPNSSSCKSTVVAYINNKEELTQQRCVRSCRRL